MEKVFHPGELAVQKLSGEGHFAQRNGRIIKDSIVSGAVNLLEKQAMLIIGSTDAKGQNWTSLLLGDFGFIKVPDTSQVMINLDLLRSSKEDILFQNIQENPKVGLLFIELATRIRYRVNGSVQEQGNYLKITVEEAYVNCPKYIQRRDIKTEQAFQEGAANINKGSILTEAVQSWIRDADTFFLTTSSLDGRTDASHRGGNKGFIKILPDQTLRIPDYPGNSMFNSLGNIYENPSTGLLFVDFEKGAILQLSGEAELVFDQRDPEDLQTTGDTGRFWHFKTKEWIHTENHHQLVWDLIDYSPFNP